MTRIAATTALVAVLLAGLIAIGVSDDVSEAPGTRNDKVTICHATSSGSNPYTTNTVDESSIDEQNNRYLNGHGDHERDIIPPFGTFPGRNWDARGQAIWENGCKPPVETTTPPTTVVETTEPPVTDPPPTDPPVTDPPPTDPPVTDPPVTTLPPPPDTRVETTTTAPRPTAPPTTQPSPRPTLVVTS